MAGTALTTQIVPRLLSVSEATFKSWADSGMVMTKRDKVPFLISILSVKNGN